MVLRLIEKKYIQNGYSEQKGLRNTRYLLEMERILKFIRISEKVIIWRIKQGIMHYFYQLLLNLMAKFQ